MENEYFGYKTVIVDISSTFYKYMDYPHGNYTFPSDFLGDLQKYGSFTSSDLTVIISLALVITIARLVLTAHVLAVRCYSM